ncbi:hypothetical protein [Maritimibacter dapengensis]|uniref:Uncharacterized protein n=1 Tax=Maritimibacter dapengensis TaxID=2836868 RepID=A0ABS6T2N1_9RHOB|nr:hypothetical protein [Maritimibacter dapengensis]MBV7379509.1 hypothetical protein [Maritimibacter dapengensis]
MLGRLIKFILIVVVLGAIGIAGYALIGDLSPPAVENSQPVILTDD